MLLVRGPSLGATINDRRSALQGHTVRGQVEVASNPLVRSEEGSEVLIRGFWFDDSCSVA